MLSAETCLSIAQGRGADRDDRPTGSASVWRSSIDIQQALIDMPADLVAVLPVAVLALQRDRARRTSRATGQALWRLLLWLGGGARHANAAVQRLKALGFGIVSTSPGPRHCG